MRLTIRKNALNTPEPLPNGTEYDGAKIVDCLQFEPHDDYQPYLYELDNGEMVWIPVR